MTVSDQLLFETTWASLTQAHGATLAEKMPKRMIWLNGSPGAGKGTHTQLILNLLNIYPQPIVISDLLQTPEARAIIDSGKLVDDEQVTRLLFQELTKPLYQEGVIIDGYPRSLPQAACIQAFQETLSKYFTEKNQPKPLFHILVLNVSEKISIERQLYRGAKALENPQGERPRATDLDPEKALKRYKVFQESTYAALQSLKGVLPYTEIDATGSIESVQTALINAFH